MHEFGTLFLECVGSSIGVCACVCVCVCVCVFWLSHGGSGRVEAGWAAMG